MIIQDEESGLPFKIISGATVSAPQGVFVKVQPLGVSATWRGNVSQNLKTELSDDYGVSGAYTTGIDTFSVVRGAFTEITVSAGTVIAWYK